MVVQHQDQTDVGHWKGSKEIGLAAGSPSEGKIMCSDPPLEAPWLEKGNCTGWWPTRVNEGTYLAAETPLMREEGRNCLRPRSQQD